MGRTKKEDVKVNVNSVGTDVIEAPVVETVAEAPKAKTQSITVTASYKTKTMEGEIIKHRFSGTGATALEALNNVKGSDEELVDEVGAPFPSRVNLLVNVTVKRGEYQFDRAIAPQVSEAIFVNKNVSLLNKLFGL